MTTPQPRDPRRTSTHTSPSIAGARIPQRYRAEVETLWDYHDMHHPEQPTDVGIGLGAHDLGVADHTAALYHRGLFPLIVFTGANAPTTLDRFPRGEAVHFRERALELGVPDDVILLETAATNTGANIANTRALLAEHNIAITSATLITRPYQQRRAWATIAKAWPELHVTSSSQRIPLDDYVAGIGDADRVINMLVGDTQRITIHAQSGFAIPQAIPDPVQQAYDRLTAAGFTTRLL